MKTAALALSCAALVIAGCTTMGTGTGSLSPDNASISFAWKSTDGGTTGAMSTALPDGRKFSGPFVQVTRDVSGWQFGPQFEPLWNGWDYGWSDWGYAHPVLSTEYSSRVMANLVAEDGQRMRCRFHLNHPFEGMSGGGQGECQLTGGRSVQAVFPAS